MTAPYAEDYARFPSLALTLDPELQTNYLLKWTQGGGPTANLLGNGRAAITYSAPIPTLGADQLLLLCYNAHAAIDCYFQIQWGHIASAGPASLNQKYFPECIATPAAAVGGYSAVTLNVAEYLVEALSRKAIAIPCASHYFRIGAYANGVPNGTFEVWVERKCAGGFGEGGL